MSSVNPAGAVNDPKSKLPPPDAVEFIVTSPSPLVGLIDMFVPATILLTPPAPPDTVPGFQRLAVLFQTRAWPLVGAADAVSTSASAP